MAYSQTQARFGNLVLGVLESGFFNLQKLVTVKIILA